MAKVITLGATVKDVLTGLVGVVSSRTDMITGTTQYAVTPPLRADGKYDDGRMIDSDLLTVTAPVSKDVKVQPAELSTIVLGQAVKNKSDGFVGIAEERTTFISGCVYYSVRAKGAKGERGSVAFLPQKLLTVTGNGILTAAQVKEGLAKLKEGDAEAANTFLPKATARTGGPSRPMHAIR